MVALLTQSIIKTIEPLVPVDLVVDHSVMIDHFGSPKALDLNMKLEFSRNQERYQFMKWGMQAFDTFKVVPPGIGIVHQVNLEYLARTRARSGSAPADHWALLATARLLRAAAEKGIEVPRDLPAAESGRAASSSRKRGAIDTAMRLCGAAWRMSPHPFTTDMGFARQRPLSSARK